MISSLVSASQVVMMSVSVSRPSVSSCPTQLLMPWFSLEHLPGISPGRLYGWIVKKSLWNLWENLFSSAAIFLFTSGERSSNEMLRLMVAAAAVLECGVGT